MKNGISVCFILKNGINQGYPFWESLSSCLPFADEIVISEGNSDDGTAAYLSKFGDKYRSPSLDIRIYRDDWNARPSSGGEVISWITERNMKRCRREWIYYLQADEIVHEGNVDFIKSVASDSAGRFNAVKFYFWHFLGSWNPVKSGAAYHEAIRMFRNTGKIRPVGDAWTFNGEITPVCPSSSVPHPLFHLGWVFPYNCDRKRVSHARIYTGHPDYQKSGAEAQERLNTCGYDKGYDMPSDPSGFPKSIERLYGKIKYELPEEARV
jgi:glycosyltransferase involved in cell wall biosynthesis